MNKLMTFIAESNSIRYFISKLGIIYKRFNMMGIEIITFVVATLLTGIFISFIYSLSPLLIFRSTPISFLFSCIFAIFIIWMSLSSFAIHGIINSRHPFCLPTSRGIRFFGLPFIPGNIPLKSFRHYLGEFFFPFLIISPLKGNSIMNRALGNIKHSQCPRNNTITQIKFFGNLANRYFVNNIPFMNKLLPRFGILLGGFFKRSYKFMAEMTPTRAIANSYVFTIDIRSLSVKTFITNWASKIFPILFHGYIIPQNQQNVHTLCRCAVGALIED